MGDVLIKNMEKPKSCFSDYKRCPFEMTSIDSRAHYCSLTGDRVFRAKMKANCPIVDVKPHARLIDNGFGVITVVMDEPTILEQASETVQVQR